MGYQKPSFKTETWDGTSPTYESRQINTLPDVSMTDRFISEIIAIQDLLFDSQGPIEFFATIGLANTVVGVDTTGSELKYKSIVGGSNITVSSSDSSIVVSSTGSGATIYSAEAGEDLIGGQPIYFSSGKLMGADSGNSSFIGVMMETTANGVSGNYAVDGKVELADWTAATGAVNLSQSSMYYMNGTTLSTTPPTTGYLHRVGRAISTTLLDIEIQPPIKL